ncbi:MAG: hypothetical protein OQJ97_17575 [Rhodospirillales bacterium]|nr:hypothetical protein [Rhodospirillales bacterium]
MMLHLIKKISILACLVWLGGCTAAETAMFGGGQVAPLAALEGASAIVTDKTLTDHIVSIASGKNCSTVRSERGLHYCEEDEPKGEAAVYCYKTIGAVTCYDRPRDGNPVLEDNSAPIVRR